MPADRIHQQTFGELDSCCSVRLILISESVSLLGFLDELNWKVKQILKWESTFWFISKWYIYKCYMILYLGVISLFKASQLLISDISCFLSFISDCISYECNRKTHKWISYERENVINHHKDPNRYTFLFTLNSLLSKVQVDFY